jgi:hypothetical protein
MILPVCHPSMEEASIVPRYPDVFFTREQLSQDLPLRPFAIRHCFNTLHFSECKLPTNALLHDSAMIDHCNGSGRHTAFLPLLPSNEETSPKYYLPMKRHSRDHLKCRLQSQNTQCYPATPDTMMSSLESIQSTPLSCHSQRFDFSPPNLNYQSPDFLVEHEKPVPANILLPSL